MTPQTQFTPGPLTVCHERNKFDSTFDSLTVVAPDGIVLATINVPAFAPHLAEPIANAHLYASAPSLYAALQALLESFPVRDEAAYWEKRISEEPELMLEPEELALMEAVNAARKALAMGSGGELGSSTPR